MSGEDEDLGEDLEMEAEFIPPLPVGDLKSFH
jgi:hypothetical protein